MEIRQILLRLLSRLCRPFVAWRALLVLVVIGPIALLHFRLSTPSSHVSRGKPVRSEVVRRWTSWDVGSGDPHYKECPAIWEKHPEAKDLRKLIPHGRKGALVIPWVDTNLMVVKPAKTICGWLVIKGEKSHDTVGKRYSASEGDFFPPLPPFPVDGVTVTAFGKQNGFEVPISVSDSFARYPDDTEEFRIYDVIIALRDPDVYRLEVLLEYSDLINVDESPQASETQAHLPVVVNQDGTPTLLSIHVQGKPLSRSTYLGLPHCQSSDHPGRWVNSSLLSKSPIATSWMSDEDETHEDLTEPLQTYDGRVWVPFECRYRRWSYRAFRDKCLGKWYGLSHWWGDGNVRRALKALTTAGAWCKEWYDESTPECQCDDRTLVTPHIGDGATGWSVVPKVAGSINATIMYASLASFTADTIDWQDLMNIYKMKEQLRPQIALGVTRVEARPSVVIVGLPTLDTTASTLSSVHSTLSSLTHALRATYAAQGVPIVLRTPQYASSPSTRLRTKLLSQFFAKSITAVLSPFTSVYIWDVHHLGDFATQSAKGRLAKCDLGHASRDMVEWENLILENVLCNKLLMQEKKVERG
ncbi:hypothetical protein SpCBS45565_g07889 [Spizellomyces sp. 'palustris']|nr:hypothetical protein SpCBS45565_g07889 [Spizellomyces sp. 'palustris']